MSYNSILCSKTFRKGEKFVISKSSSSSPYPCIYVGTGYLSTTVYPIGLFFSSSFTSDHYVRVGYFGTNSVSDVVQKTTKTFSSSSQAGYYMVYDI